MNHSMKRIAFGMLLAAGMFAAGCAQQPVEPKAEEAVQLFETTEAAVQALHDLIGAKDRAAIERMFGAGAVELFSSGDPHQDREDFQLVKEMIAAGVAFDEPDAETRIPLFGADRWPWPIPLVRTEGGWYFDTAAGREELLNRRIGRNELSTLSSLHAVVDAQEEYASEGRDGNPPAFAMRFMSTPGKRDGLYWAPVEGEPVSPLGDLLAESEYTSGSREPYHGYFYRILTGQGASAPGGAQSYLDERGMLTRGFAVVAWPAKYGNSGIMTFLINHRGIVFQKDLGEDTYAVASAMSSYDPDVSWLPTADRLEAVATE
jgi:hypothetical protein